MKDYKVIACANCGNKGLNRIVAKYKQVMHEFDEEGPDLKSYNDLQLLECPVCRSITLSNTSYSDLVTDSNGEYIYSYNTIYPETKIFVNTPYEIGKAYEAAVKTAKIDNSISLIAIRAVLEKICKERGSTRKNLQSMLKQMVDKNILPETLDKCSYIIRKLGNEGAHGDNIIITNDDIEELISFIETIMFYIYELPVKIEQLNNKYSLQLTNNTQNIDGLNG